MLLLILTIVAQSQPVPMHCGTPVFDRIKLSQPLPAAPAKKPADPPRLGESRTFWLQNMSVMPPVQFQAQMTCRGRGPHCYVMIDDSVWNAGLVDSADVARIVERFERSSPRDSTRGVWQWNTTVLGRPPDEIDADSAIYLLYYNIGTFRGISFDGFWQYFDQYHDTTAMRRWGYHSNEVECVYLDCYPAKPSSDYRMAIAAHEFAHMITWNYDHAEEVWQDEGFAELAMWLFGSPDPVSGFPQASDNCLTNWTGSWSDYIKTYLWSLFLYEQYGGRVGTDLIHNIIASPLPGIEGVNAGFDSTGIPVHFEQALDHWVLLNRINDTTFAGGKYGYYGERVDFAVAAYHSSYPVETGQSLDNWAGEYVQFQNGLGLDLAFHGNGSPDFRLYLYARDRIHGRHLLDTLTLDSLTRAHIFCPWFDTAYQSVYLIPVNHNLAGRMPYNYTASVTGGVAERPATGPGTRRFSAVLNVAGLERLGPGCDVLSPAGRLAARTDDRGSLRALSPGIYFLVQRNDPATRRILLLR